MVYLHFPPGLTEEEQMLQAKYQKLKKKKKAVLALKAPKGDAEKPTLAKGGPQARDARELARKLLKSGAIRAIASPAPKHERLSFKRPRAARERKLSGPGSLDKVSSYRPFGAPLQDGGGGGGAGGPPPSPSPSLIGDGGDSRPAEGSASPPPPPLPPSTTHGKADSLYDSFVQGKLKDEHTRHNNKKGDGGGARNNAHGTTVFVLGRGVTEDFLRKHMCSFGTITNVSMEIEKNRGFVTFEKSEVAQKVISELNATTVGGIQLEVSMARRQPHMERINEASSSAAWCTIATSHSQKGQHKDGRTVVTYDDDIFS